MTRAYSKKFVLGRAPTQFPYSFTFPFSTDGKGIGLYVAPLSMWEYVKNGVRLVIRELLTSIGVTPAKEAKVNFKQVLTTSIGLVSNYVKSLLFYRKLSTKLGMVAESVKLAVIKVYLSTKIGTYTRGFWSNYNYSKTVVVNPSIDGALFSYPMKLIIHRTTGVDTTSNVYVGSDCSFDYSDIYFDTESGEPLWYWIESSTDSEAVVWIKVTNIPASPTTTAIRFYYGSTMISVRNSGTSTFTFFDDFSAGLSNWTSTSGVAIIGEELVIQSTDNNYTGVVSTGSYNINYAFRARAKTGHYNNLSYGEDISWSDETYDRGLTVSYSSDEFISNAKYMNRNASGTYYSDIVGWSAGTYHIQDMIRNSTISSIYLVDNANSVSVASFVDTLSRPIRMYTDNAGSQINIDWILIRPYTTNEPAFGAWGSKVTYATSPFRTYLLTFYRKLSTKAGLVATRLAKIARIFSIVKIGLQSSISNTTNFVRTLSSKIGAKSNFIYSLSFNRFLNSTVGFAVQHSAGLFKTFSTTLGLISDTTQSAARYLSATLGLVSDYITTREFKRYLSTTVGVMGFSFRTAVEYIQYLTTALGLVATRGIKELTTSLISQVGLVSTLRRTIESYFNFISNMGLVSSFVRQYSSVRDLSSNVGLIVTEGYRNISIAINTAIGLTSSYIRGLTYDLSTSIGLKSSVDRLIEVYRIFQNIVGVALTGDKRVLFEEVLSATLGLVSDVWYKSGGRVREMVTSFGLTASLSETTGYYRELMSKLGVIAKHVFNTDTLKDLSFSVGIVSSTFRNITTNLTLNTVAGLQSILFRNITSLVIFTTTVGLISNQYFKLGIALASKLGLTAIRGAMGWSGRMNTLLGLVSLIDRHRHDYETLTASVGLVATKVSRWFGLKRFKTLKFLNPSTKDNKKLWIGK